MLNWRVVQNLCYRMGHLGIFKEKVVMAKETDKKTLDLIKEVNKRKQEISQTEKYHPITNCTFSYIEGSANNVVNLHVENDVKKLICIASFLKDKEKSYNEMSESLKVNDIPAFSWNNFVVSAWIKDIKARINKIQISSKKKNLERLNSRLDAIISPELRTELELKSIEDELS